MQYISKVAQGIDLTAFAWYGMTCLRSAGMVAEFHRYRLPRLRTLVGSLQLLASLGLAVGYRYPPLATAAAGGLAAMMLGGVAVRLRIRDPLVAAAPAFLLLCLNLYLVLWNLGLIA